MKTHNSKEQKALGRKVTGSTEVEWMKYRGPILEEIKWIECINAADPILKPRLSGSG